MATSELTKLTLTFPTRMILDVTEAVLAIQQEMQEAGEPFQVGVVRNASLTPRRREEDAVPDIDGGTVEGTGTVRAQRRAATTRIARTGANSVVYRVVDPTVKVTPRNQEVRMYLLKHGPKTARQLMDEMDLGRKVIESALHGLRTAESVESVEDNGKVTQKKFSKAEIKAAGTGE